MPVKLELIREKSVSFPNIDNPGQYREIKVWHCAFRSLRILSSFENAETLEIAGFPDDDLDCLSSLRALKRLRIVHLPRVSSIEPLGRLSNLEELELSTLPGWDAGGKRTIIDSLAPLGNLKKLRVLVVSGVVPEDKSLEPLAGCASLREIRTGNHYSIEQLTKALKHRHYEGAFFKPYVELTYGICGTCHAAKVMLSGVSGRSVFCPVCNEKRVREHVELWNRLMSS